MLTSTRTNMKQAAATIGRKGSLPQYFRIIATCSCYVLLCFSKIYRRTPPFLLWGLALPRLGSWVQIPSPAPIFSFKQAWAA